MILVLQIILLVAWYAVPLSVPLWVILLPSILIVGQLLLALSILTLNVILGVTWRRK